MTEFTYEPIEFRIPTFAEGFYHYRQKVSIGVPRYRYRHPVGIDRRPSQAWDPRRSVVRFRVCHRWLASTSRIPHRRDAAIQHAIDKIKALGREGYEKDTPLRNASCNIICRRRSPIRRLL